MKLGRLVKNLKPQFVLNHACDHLTVFKKISHRSLCFFAPHSFLHSFHYAFLFKNIKSFMVAFNLLPGFIYRFCYSQTSRGLFVATFCIMFFCIFRSLSLWSLEFNASGYIPGDGSFSQNSILLSQPNKICFLVSNGFSWMVLGASIFLFAQSTIELIGRKIFLSLGVDREKRVQRLQVYKPRYKTKKTQKGAKKNVVSTVTNKNRKWLKIKPSRMKRTLFGLRPTPTPTPTPTQRVLKSFKSANNILMHRKKYRIFSNLSRFSVKVLFFFKDYRSYQGRNQSGRFSRKLFNCNLWGRDSQYNFFKKYQNFLTPLPKIKPFFIAFYGLGVCASSFFVWFFLYFQKSNLGYNFIIILVMVVLFDVLLGHNLVELFLYLTVHISKSITYVSPYFLNLTPIADVFGVFSENEIINTIDFLQTSILEHVNLLKSSIKQKNGRYLRNSLTGWGYIPKFYGIFFFEAKVLFNKKIENLSKFWRKKRFLLPLLFFLKFAGYRFKVRSVRPLSSFKVFNKEASRANFFSVKTLKYSFRHKFYKTLLTADSFYSIRISRFYKYRKLILKHLSAKALGAQIMHFQSQIKFNEVGRPGYCANTSKPTLDNKHDKLLYRNLYKDFRFSMPQIWYDRSFYSIQSLFFNNRWYSFLYSTPLTGWFFSSALYSIFISMFLNVNFNFIHLLLVTQPTYNRVRPRRW